jgi:hypothetical protein
MSAQRAETFKISSCPKIQYRQKTPTSAPCPLSFDTTNWVWDLKPCLLMHRILKQSKMKKMLLLQAKARDVVRSGGWVFDQISKIWSSPSPDPCQPIDAYSTFTDLASNRRSHHIPSLLHLVLSWVCGGNFASSAFISTRQKWTPQSASWCTSWRSRLPIALSS